MSRHENRGDGGAAVEEVRRVQRGLGVLVALVALVGAGYYGVPPLSRYLQAHAASPAAAGEVELGTWVVAAVVALFLVWCFSGSRGGRR